MTTVTAAVTRKDIFDAAQYRAETSDRARNIVAQEEARQRFQSFLGDGRAYTPTR